jgi:hypothetical protein
MELQKFNDEEALLLLKTDLLTTAATITEINDRNVNNASNFVKQIDTFLKSVKNERLAFTRKLDEVKKQFMSKEHELCDELTNAKTTIQGLISAYLTEKERQRIEAEKERAMLEAEAELAQQEAEEKVRQDAEIASMFGNNAPQETPPPPPPEMPPLPIVEKTVVSNVRQVKVARWNITDASKLPREFLSVDESKIRAFANDKMKAGIDLKSIQIDGIEFFEEISAQLR